MASIKRIGVITSGGDCGGLNAVIKGIAREAYSKGIESVVIPNGYAGLYNLVALNDVVLLNADRVSRIEASVAGSEAGHSRVKISKIDDCSRHRSLGLGQKLGIEIFRSLIRRRLCRTEFPLRQLLRVNPGHP